MTIHLPDDLESSIEAVVHSGRFASVDDAMAEAARLLLRQVTPGQPEPVGQADLTPEERADQDLQQRLLAAGIISEIKPPITDLTPYRNRRAVPIQGEPISETVIRERR
ncbi:MAG: hypothetical protein JO114_03525 [Planctomycetaceae bacterium]|nr:hypothetical protein [Planctomycetaceae bacterium]